MFLFLICPRKDFTVGVRATNLAEGMDRLINIMLQHRDLAHRTEPECWDAKYCEGLRQRVFRMEEQEPQAGAPVIPNWSRPARPRLDRIQPILAGAKGGR